MKEKRKIIFSYKTVIIALIWFAIHEMLVYFIFKEAKGYWGIRLKLSGYFVGTGILVSIFKFPNYISYNDYNMLIVGGAFWDTKMVLEKYSEIIKNNDCIFFDEVEKVEFVLLSRKEIKQFVCHNYLGNGFLKIHIKNSSTKKYIYVFGYSWWQIRKIKRILLQKANI